MEALFDQEIKTALCVNIVSERTETTGMLMSKTTNYFYVI